MRILVIRRDNIGDLVCTTPLFAALRARYPEAHIAALVNSYNAPVLKGNPHLDEVHSYTKLKHRLPGQSRIGILLSRIGMIARLRRRPFDYIVLAKAGFDRQGLSLARQLRSRHVVGYGPAPADVRGLTLTIPGPPDPTLHEVEVMQRLGEALDVRNADGPLHVHPDAERVASWRARLAPLIAGGRRLLIGVHFSARQPRHRWAPERWVELVRRLSASGEAGVVLLWSPGPENDARHPGDDETAAAIQRQIRDPGGVLPAATAELADLIAVLAVCDAFIGADGGAMHLAAAAGLPTVALFGNVESNVRRWHPWRVRHELVSPATGDVADITVEQVVQAWQRLGLRRVRSG